MFQFEKKLPILRFARSEKLEKFLFQILSRQRMEINGRKGRLRTEFHVKGLHRRNDFLIQFVEKANAQRIIGLTDPMDLVEGQTAEIEATIMLKSMDDRGEIVLVEPIGHLLTGRLRRQFRLTARWKSRTIVFEVWQRRGKISIAEISFLSSTFVGGRRRGRGRGRINVGQIVRRIRQTEQIQRVERRDATRLQRGVIRGDVISPALVQIEFIDSHLIGFELALGAFQSKELNFAETRMNVLRLVGIVLVIRVDLNSQWNAFLSAVPFQGEIGRRAFESNGQSRRRRAVRRVPNDFHGVGHLSRANDRQDAVSRIHVDVEQRRRLILVQPLLHQLSLLRLQRFLPEAQPKNGAEDRRRGIVQVRSMETESDFVRLTLIEIRRRFFVDTRRGRGQRVENKFELRIRVRRWQRRRRRVAAVGQLIVRVEKSIEIVAEIHLDRRRRRKILVDFLFAHRTRVLPVE